MAYDDTNRFTLGKNKALTDPEHADKDKSKWPAYKGKINVEGRTYYLSGWIQENGSTGEKFFSGSVEAPQDARPAETPAQQPANAHSAPAAGGYDDFDDDIPF